MLTLPLTHLFKLSLLPQNTVCDYCEVLLDHSIDSQQHYPTKPPSSSYTVLILLTGFLLLPTPLITPFTLLPPLYPDYESFFTPTPLYSYIFLPNTLTTHPTLLLPILHLLAILLSHLPHTLPPPHTLFLMSLT